MRLFSFLVLTLAAGCATQPLASPADGAARCPGPDGGTFLDSDPRSVRSVHCHSVDGVSDARVEIARRCPEDGSFVAEVSQTTPTVITQHYDLVLASWSGHFFNFFDGPIRNSGERFHVLTRGLPNEGNLEVYGDASMMVSLVNVGALDCTIDRE